MARHLVDNTRHGGSLEINNRSSGRNLAMSLCVGGLKLSDILELTSSTSSFLMPAPLRTLSLQRAWWFCNT